MKTINKHWPKIISVFLLIVLFTAYINTFAVFSPGETLDPTCAPNDAGCIVLLLPDQTGNSGKYLTTDGTNASWDSTPVGVTASSVDVFTNKDLTSGTNTFPTFNQNTTGNAATVTTNANLTGVVTSIGNATSIANGAITNAMLANGAVSSLSGVNTGDETLSSIKTKLGITTLSGSNTGDQDLSSLVPYTGGTSNVDLGVHNLTVDTNTLFVDSVNHRVGIGTISPTYSLDVNGIIKNRGTTGIQAYFSSNGAVGDSSYITVAGARAYFGYNGTTANTVVQGGGTGKGIEFNVNNVTFGSGTAMTILSNGNVGIGIISPTAVLHLKAGTATANTAPLKFTSGTNLTTGEAGAMEYDGGELYFTPTGTTRETIAYVSDLTSGYVPYTGATGNVDLGVNTLTSKILKAYDASGTYSNMQMSTSVTNPREMHYIGSSSGNGISNIGFRIVPDASITSQKPIFLELKTNNNDTGVYRSYWLQNTTSTKFVSSSGGGTGVGTPIDITTQGENYTIPGIYIGNTANQLVGIGRTSSTARLHLPAGTATVNTAPLKLTAGTNLTTAETGAMEYDGTNLYFTPTGTTRKTVAYSEDTAPASVYPATGLSTGYIPYKTSTTLSNSTLYLDGNNLTYGTSATKIFFRNAGTAFAINRDTTTGVMSNASESGFNFGVSGTGAAGFSRMQHYLETGAATTAYMQFMGSGNVLISTTTDDGVHKLQVGGSIRTTSDIDLLNNLRFEGTAPLIYSNGYSQPIKIDGSSVLLNTNSNGNVGIGTTSPGSQLEVYGSNPRLTSKVNSGGLGYASFSSSSTTSGFPRASFYIGDSNGDTVTNVGFTVAPDVSAAVQKSAFIEVKTNPANSASEYRLLMRQSTTLAELVASSNTGATVGTPLSVYTYGNGNQLYLSTNGNVGIGTNSNTYQLMVGNNTISGIVARFSSSNGYCDINPLTSSLICSSDINLKKNIVTLDNEEFALQTIPDLKKEDTLSKIMNLTPVRYNWNTEGDTDSKHIGFIAQEMEQIFPDLVSTDPITGLKSVSYANITPYLVKSIQEMNLKIDNILSLDTNSSMSLGSLIKDFLGNIGNNIDIVFFGEVRTKKLCLDDLCIDKEQLQQILNNNGLYASSNNSNTNTNSTESNSTSTTNTDTSTTDTTEDTNNTEENITTDDNNNINNSEEVSEVDPIIESTPEQESSPTDSVDNTEDVLPTEDTQASL